MNANKKIEKTKKYFEKMFSCPVSYHEEGGWDGKNGHFTIKLRDERFVPKIMGDKKWLSFHWKDIGGGKKRGVLTPIKKNVKILNDYEKILVNGQPVNFQIKNSDGELIKVSKEEFAKWMENEKNVKTPPKESLVYVASGDIDGTTVFMERKGKDGVIKESYYQPRSEEDKNKIIERNRKRREEEKSQKNQKGRRYRFKRTDKGNKTGKYQKNFS